MNKQQISIRLDSTQKARLDVLVSVSKLSQQDYVLQRLFTEDAQIDSGLADIIASQQRTIESLTKQLELAKQNSASSHNLEPVSNIATHASSYQVGVCVSGSEADKLLLEAKVDQHSKNAPKDKPKLVLVEGLLWIKSKTANGNQKTLKAIAKVPPELLEIYSDSYSLYDLKNAVDNYSAITAFENFDKLPKQDREEYISDCFQRDKDRNSRFLKRVQTAIDSYINTHTPNEIAATISRQSVDLETVVGASTTKIAVRPAAKLPSESLETLHDKAFTPQLTRTELANRLATNPQETKTFAATLTNLGGAKMKQKAIIAWTSGKDPDRLGWMPTDESRETWRVTQSDSNLDALLAPEIVA